MKRHLIIGNGGAAFNALKAIRSLQAEDEITIVSQENCPAYSPMLTPYYVAGSIPYSAVFLCPRSFYSNHRARVLLGKGAIAVEAESQRVYLDDGQILNYDELLIATGSSPVIPSIPGADLGLTLWTVRDAQRLRAALRRAGPVAVVGAGLIGLQIVDILLKLKREVALIEIRDRVLPRVLDKEGAAMVADRLLDSGVNLHLGAQVREVTKGRCRAVLTLDSGAKLEAGTVLFAIGVRPNIAFLVEDSRNGAGTSLKIDRGIAVDEGGRTNMEHIFAAGDVAQIVDRVNGHSEVNAIWTNAIHGGWAAGCNMAGQRTLRRQTIRINALSPAGLPVVSLGLVEPETGRDEVVVRQSKNYYRKLVFRANRLIGAVLVGDIEEAGILSQAIEGEGLLPPLKAELERSSAFHSLAKSTGLYRAFK